MKKILFTSFAFLVTPILVLAQQNDPLANAVNNATGGPGQGIRNIIVAIGDMIRLMIPILIALAVVVFFWGLVKYIWGQGKDTEGGRKTMIAGLISLFVMVTLWGILAFAAGTIGIGGFNNGSPLNPPHVSN